MHNHQIPRIHFEANLNVFKYKSIVIYNDDEAIECIDKLVIYNNFIYFIMIEE